jgi:hypothetical protein
MANPIKIVKAVAKVIAKEKPNVVVKEPSYKGTLQTAADIKKTGGPKPSMPKSKAPQPTVRVKDQGYRGALQTSADLKKASGLAGREGKLGGQHMGGHGGH